MAVQSFGREREWLGTDNKTLVEAELVCFGWGSAFGAESVSAL